MDLFPTVFDYQDDRYSRYVSSSEYSFDEGLELVPLCKSASDPPPHFVLARRHAPVGTRVVRGGALKHGTPPVLPAMTDTPSGDIFAHGAYNLSHPVSSEVGGTEGMRTWEANWEFTYHQAGPFGTARDRYTVFQPGYLPGVGIAPVPVGVVKVRPLLSTGRPPYVRISTDGTAALILGLLGNIPIIGGAIQAAVATVLDFLLGGLAIDANPPNLSSPSYNDMGVDVRPYYFSEGIVR